MTLSPDFQPTNVGSRLRDYQSAAWILPGIINLILSAKFVSGLAELREYLSVLIRYAVHDTILRLRAP